MVIVGKGRGRKRVSVSRRHRKKRNDGWSDFALLHFDREGVLRVGESCAKRKAGFGGKLLLILTHRGTCVIVSIK